MHIADGVLSNEVCAVTGALALGAVGYSLHRLKDSLPGRASAEESPLTDQTVPLTGMMAALIFAGQMVNFPLIGTPVSGHLMGGVLAAAVVGPWAGCIALTMVLLVQCALFGDGGITALGANVLHMAVVGSIGGYAVLATVRRLLGGGTWAAVVGVVGASWLSVMAAASLFCVEFAVSWAGREYPFSRIFTLMVTYHSLIGIGEALITGAVVKFVLLQRPDLIVTPAPGTLAGGVGRVVVAGAVCALAVAAFLAPFKSSHRDGLEAVAGQTFADRMDAPARSLLLTDYAVPLPRGWEQSELWQRLSVSLAGLFGTGAVLLLSLVFGRALRAEARENHT